MFRKTLLFVGTPYVIVLLLLSQFDISFNFVFSARQARILSILSGNQSRQYQSKHL